MIDLRVALAAGNQQYYFNTRRLVYQTFIDPTLDYKETGLYVINKDGNGYNNCLDNLQLATKSYKQRRVKERGRVFPFLQNADRSNWRKNYSTSKPVKQYNLNGELVARHNSIRDASRATGIDDKSIIQVAKGLYKQWKGFVFKYV